MLLSLSRGGNCAINLDIYYSDVLLAFLLLMFVRELIYDLLATGPEATVKFSFWLPMLVEERCRYLMVMIDQILVYCHYLTVS